MEVNKLCPSKLAQQPLQPVPSPVPLQCTNNPKFMKAQCPLSCRECCLPDDVLCERARRRASIDLHLT